MKTKKSWSFGSVVKALSKVSTTEVTSVTFPWIGTCLVHRVSEDFAKRSGANEFWIALPGERIPCASIRARTLKDAAAALVAKSWS